MATESELADLLRRLEDLLADVGLDFVVDQERILAVEGVATRLDDVADAAAREYVDTNTGRRRVHRVRGDDAIRRPLSTAERIAALLDLVEVATAATIEMERMVRWELAEVMGFPSNELTVRFSPPEETLLRGESDTGWELPDAAMLDTKREAASVVVGLLDELRRQAEVQRGGWLVPETAAGETAGREHLQ